MASLQENKSSGKSSNSSFETSQIYDLLSFVGSFVLLWVCYLGVDVFSTIMNDDFSSKVSYHTTQPDSTEHIRTRLSQPPTAVDDILARSKYEDKEPIGIDVPPARDERSWFQRTFGSLASSVRDSADSFGSSVRGIINEDDEYSEEEYDNSGRIGRSDNSKRSRSGRW